MELTFKDVADVELLEESLKLKKNPCLNPESKFSVLDDEEEALDALKAVQVSQAQRLKENNMRVFLKISHVERQLLEVTATVE